MKKYFFFLVALFLIGCGEKDPIENNSEIIEAKKNISIHSTDPAAYRHLGDLYFSHQRYEKAISEYLKAEVFDSDSVETLIALGKGYKEIGNIERARFFLNEAKKRKPEEPEIQKLLEALEEP